MTAEPTESSFQRRLGLRTLLEPQEYISLSISLKASLSPRNVFRLGWFRHASIILYWPSSQRKAFLQRETFSKHEAAGVGMLLNLFAGGGRVSGRRYCHGIVIPNGSTRRRHASTLLCWLSRQRKALLLRDSYL